MNILRPYLWSKSSQSCSVRRKHAAISQARGIPKLQSYSYSEQLYSLHFILPSARPTGERQVPLRSPLLQCISLVQTELSHNKTTLTDWITSNIQRKSIKSSDSQSSPAVFKHCLLFFFLKALRLNHGIVQVYSFSTSTQTKSSMGITQLPQLLV